MTFVLFAAFPVGRAVSAIIREMGPLPALVVTHASDPQEADLASAWDAVGVPVLRGAAVNGPAVLEALTALAPERCVLAWWPDIVKSPVLDVPRQGWVNMHPSLLPYGRGKHGYYWSIVDQEPFGVSLHLIDAGIDTGGVLAQQSLPVRWTDTGETLYARGLEAIVALFRTAWPAIARGALAAQPQDPRAGSYHWGREIGPHSRIDLDATYSGRALLNILRGRTFWDGDSAWFEDGGKRYRVKVRIEEVEA